MTMYFAIVDIECNEPVLVYHTRDEAVAELRDAGLDSDPCYEIMPVDGDSITAYRLDVLTRKEGV